jgi:hypothetical protein
VRDSIIVAIIDQEVIHNNAIIIVVKDLVLIQDKKEDQENIKILIDKIDKKHTIFIDLHMIIMIDHIIIEEEVNQSIFFYINYILVNHNNIMKVNRYKLYNKK